MTQRERQEIDLVRRAAALGMQLWEEREGDFYLLYEAPDMRGFGPHCLDEIEDFLTGVENEMTYEQAREFMLDQRWRRIHPELYDDEDEE